MKYNRIKKQHFISVKWYDIMHFFPSEYYTLNCTYLPVPPIIVAGNGGGREGSASFTTNLFRSEAPNGWSRLKTNEVPA